MYIKSLSRRGHNIPIRRLTQPVCSPPSSITLVYTNHTRRYSTIQNQPRELLWVLHIYRQVRKHMSSYTVGKSTLFCVAHGAKTKREVVIIIIGRNGKTNWSQ